MLYGRTWEASPGGSLKRNEMVAPGFDLKPVDGACKFVGIVNSSNADDVSKAWEANEVDMSWTRFVLTVLAGGTVSSLTDWLFMGDLLYRRNNQYPEIWRYPGGQGESKAIAWSSPLPFLTCAVFALVCNQLHVHSYSAALRMALEIWLICPMPLLLTNALFMKVQPMIATAHSLGWLVKLGVAAVTAVLILR